MTCDGRGKKGDALYFVADRPITHAQLLEIFYYDPDTGIFTWKVKPNNLVEAGTSAGTNLKGDYARINIKRKSYPRSRLAWFYITGKWPQGLIDHINRDRRDDRFCNLREASVSQNNANSKPRRTSSTGFKGVRASSSGRRYYAQIKAFGKAEYLGAFDTAEAAHAAYMKAAASHFGQFARSK